MNFQRVLIRAVSIGTELVMFEIPLWKPGVWIMLSKFAIPNPERQYLHPGFRCNVDANLDANDPRELHITNWGLF